MTARFPGPIPAFAVDLHRQVSPSLRETSHLLTQRGLVISHESVRAWLNMLPAGSELQLRGPWLAACRPVVIRREYLHLWTAEAGDGQVLDLLVQARRDERQARLDLGRGVSRLLQLRELRLAR